MPIKCQEHFKVENYELSKILGKDKKQRKNGSKVQIELCGQEAIFSMESLLVDPDEVVRGDELETYVEAEPFGDIYVHTLDVDVRQLSMQIFEESLPLIEFIPAGESFEIDYDYTIPSDLGPGPVDITFKVKNDLFTELICIKVSFTLE